MNGVNVCFNFKVSEHSLRALYDFILVPRAAILLASALEQELWQGQKKRKSADHGLPAFCAASEI